MRMLSFTIEVSPGDLHPQEAGWQIRTPLPILIHSEHRLDLAASIATDVVDRICRLPLPVARAVDLSQIERVASVGVVTLLIVMDVTVASATHRKLLWLCCSTVSSSPASAGRSHAQPHLQRCQTQTSVHALTAPKQWFKIASLLCDLGCNLPSFAHGIESDRAGHESP